MRRVKSFGIFKKGKLIFDRPPGQVSFPVLSLSVCGQELRIMMIMMIIVNVINLHKLRQVFFQFTLILIPSFNIIITILPPGVPFSPTYFIPSRPFSSFSFFHTFYTWSPNHQVNVGSGRDPAASHTTC